MKSRAPMFILVFIFCLNFHPAVSQELEKYFPDTDWRTATPEQQGLNSAALADAVHFLAEQKTYHIHSLLVIRNGYVVTDANFYPYVSGEPHDLASVTKSITATLVGIAIQQGYLQNVNQRIGDIIAVPEDKAAITLQDLLTMRSGIDCGVDDTIPLKQMTQTADWSQFVLNLPVQAQPGTHWFYCSPGVHLLAAILQQATGQDVFDFAMQNLFEPLGIQNVGWPRDPQGVVHGWGDLRLTPYDMAKIGYLYLNDGVWDGQRLLPEGWVTDATHNIRPPGEPGYGYLWWLFDGFYAAQGRGGQYILIIPNENLIVVTTAGADVRRDTLLNDYILPAIESDAPLAQNAAAEAALQDAEQTITLPPVFEAHPVKSLPPIVQDISGRIFQLDQNPFGLLTVALSFGPTGGAALHVTTTGALAGDEDFTWVAGLNGIPRTAPGRFDLPASGIGGWIDESTFIMQVDEIANNNLWDIHIIFYAKNIALTMNGVPGNITVTGTIQE